MKCRKAYSSFRFKHETHPHSYATVTLTIYVAKEAFDQRTYEPRQTRGDHGCGAVELVAIKQRCG